MRQVLKAGALGRPRGMGWRGRREGGSGWGTHVNPWLIHVNVWQKPLQYCRVISLQLVKINKKILKIKNSALLRIMVCELQLFFPSQNIVISVYHSVLTDFCGSPVSIIISKDSDHTTFFNKKILTCFLFFWWLPTLLP